MDKNEFLGLLRESLEGEVDNSVIEKNISFYNDYISSQPGKSEEEVIKEIGDPRLIAKTIIEAESSSGGQTGGNYDSYNRNYDYSEYDDNNKSSKYNRVYHVKWYHMVLVVIILLLLFTTLIRIGWMLIRFLFVFFVPILFILLLWVLFRKR